jgi:hypothetical protein
MAISIIEKNLSLGKLTKWIEIWTKLWTKLWTMKKMNNKLKFELHIKISIEFIIELCCMKALNGFQLSIELTQLNFITT